MQQRVGVWAAALSSAFGGGAIASTRLLGGSVAPELLGALRFGIAGLVLLPAVLLLVRRRLTWRDLLAVAGLGLVGFGLFPVIYNNAIAMTSASRAAMALCTMPLQTMLLAAALGLERLSARRSLGVLLAMAGVAVALLGGLDDAPEGAWRGDLLMLGATALMALYNVQSRRVIARTGVLAFSGGGMLAGALALTLFVAVDGGFGVLDSLSLDTWAIVAYLALFGGVAAMLLWSFALKHAPVTVVAVSVTVSPVSATLIAAVLLGEPVGLALVAGLVVVVVGIRLTASAPRTPAV